MYAEDPPMTDAFQFEETDFNYLSRRWEAAGMHYFYEHDVKGHTLVLGDDTTRVDTIDGAPSICSISIAAVHATAIRLRNRRRCASKPPAATGTSSRGGGSR